MELNYSTIVDRWWPGGELYFRYQITSSCARWSTVVRVIVDFAEYPLTSTDQATQCNNQGGR